MAIKKKKKPNFEFLRETSPSIPLQRGKFRKVDQYRRNPETGQLERYQIEIPLEEDVEKNDQKNDKDLAEDDSNNDQNGSDSE